MAELDLDSDEIVNEHSGPSFIPFGDGEYTYKVKQLFPFTSGNPNKKGETSHRAHVEILTSKNPMFKAGDPAMLGFATGSPTEARAKSGQRQLRQFVNVINGRSPMSQENVMGLLKEAVEAGEALAELGIKAGHKQWQRTTKNGAEVTEYQFHGVK